MNKLRIVDKTQFVRGLSVIVSIPIMVGIVASNLSSADTVTLNPPIIHDSTMDIVGKRIAKEVKKPKKKKVVSRSMDSQLDLTDKEFNILCKITQAETDGTIAQKMNIAQVVINRVKSEKFPNNVEDVVFARNQFQPTFDHRYYEVKVNAETVKAVTNVLNGRKIHDSLFFQAYYSDSAWFRSLDFTFQDGVHRFYK